MPSYCAVINCKKNAARHAGIRFFRWILVFYMYPVCIFDPFIRIPSAIGIDRKVCEISQRRQEAWIRAIKREGWSDKLTKYGRVCSRHFHSGEPASLWDETHPDWIPSIHMGYGINHDNSHVDGYKRLQKRVKNATLPSVPSSSEDDAHTSEGENIECDKESLKYHLHIAKEEIGKLKEELNYLKLDEKYLKQKGYLVLYYTGFPQFVYVENIYKLCEPYLVARTLTKFQQLLLTLMKLRLNLQYSDLAHRFLCHRSTVARTFERVVEILYCKLKTLIIWPSREDIQLNMPLCFKNVFGNRTTVIIDCFEVLIQKSSNPEASARTWSHYKHHHTIKFLIGISPQGVIMFISNAYGGRASDKFIVENSGFLHNLIRGDLILADRGFTIDDSVNIYCAEVRYPSFLSKRKQLSAVDTETTRKLASVRIHVERVIGLLRRKYRILSEKFPIHALKKGDENYALIDKIVVVCSVFINLCPGIIPLD